MEKPAIQLKRHYAELSEKETDDVVNVLADLIVDYFKSGGRPKNGMSGLQKGDGITARGD